MDWPTFAALALLVPLSLLACWIIYDLATDNIAGAFRDAFTAIKDALR